MAGAMRGDATAPTERGATVAKRRNMVDGCVNDFRIASELKVMRCWIYDEAKREC